MLNGTRTTQSEYLMDARPASATALARDPALLANYWAPFSQLDRRANRRVTIVRGKSSRVWDDTGRDYLDATASLWYVNVGHGRTSIAQAVADQMGELACYSNFGEFATGPTERLTRRIAGLAPLEDPLVFLTSGGSDAVDSAVKIVRRYWQLQGEKQRSVIISRSRSYHGMHGYGTALAGISANASGYGDSRAPGFVTVPENDADALNATVEEVGPERVAAVFAEPVIGAGGVIPPVDGYLQRVREICDRYGILFVADEVVSGFGRLGTWFASERYHVEPDLLLMAKGLTSGYLPLGGVIAARRVWAPFHDAAQVFRHGYTYSGHASACAAAMANLDIIEGEQLLARVRDLEPVLAQTLEPLADHDLVAEVRHAGMLAAVQIRPGEPTLVEAIVTAARRHGILTRALAGGALQVSPPFVITPEELAELSQGLRSALDEVAGTRG